MPSREFFVARQFERPLPKAGKIELSSSHYTRYDAALAIKQEALDVLTKEKGSMAEQVEPSGDPYCLVVTPTQRLVIKMLRREHLIDVTLCLNSSLLKEVRWKEDPEEEKGVGRLKVRFPNGAAWVYDKVTEQEYFSIVTAESPGQMFNALIKGKKEGRQVA